ncbi:hypothetical protein ACHAQE_003861 [Botrytis cinerea]
MSATLESDSDTLPSNFTVEDNCNNVFPPSPPKDFGTGGCAPSTGIRPSTPTPSSKNNSMPTPVHTPDSERLLSPWDNVSSSSRSKRGILHRDRYDLNYTRTSARLHYILNLESENLRVHYQNLQFYRKWTSHLISHLPGITVTINLESTPPENHITTSPPSHTHSVIRNDDPYDFPPRADYLDEITILTRQKNLLQKNELVTAKSELHALTKHLISLPLPQIYQNKYNEADTLLYRVQTATSHSPYDRTTGIRCSGWVDSLYTSGVADKRERDGRAFQSHCNYTSNPSPYMSVSTSVARLMKFIEFRVDKEAESRVFVISLNRLKKLGIKAQSTEKYLKRFVNSLGVQKYEKCRGRGDIGENEVSFVTETHWLIEGWIPDQAIVSEMDCGDFWKIAEREGINRVAALKYLMDKEIEARKIDLEKWPKRDM